VDEGETCGVCGKRVDVRPVTWSMQISDRGTRWLCEKCTRDNVRSIEGKLDEAWW
jgi:hypothetical protein